jgi:hypothetical protein
MSFQEVCMFIIAGKERLIMREYQQPEQDYGQEPGYGPGWGRRGGHQRGHHPHGQGFGPQGQGNWQDFGPGGRGDNRQGFGPQEQGFRPQEQGFNPDWGYRRGPFQGRGFGFGPGFRGQGHRHGFGFGPGFMGRGRHQGFGFGPGFRAGGHQHGFGPRQWGWGGRSQFSKEAQIAWLEQVQGFLEQKLDRIKAKLTELRGEEARGQESRPAGPSQTFNHAGSQDTDVSML